MVRYLDIKINHGNRATTHDLKGAPVASTNSFDAHGTLEVGEQSYEIYRLAAVEGSDTLPYSLKVLLENLLRTSPAPTRLPAPRFPPRR